MLNCSPKRCIINVGLVCLAIWRFGNLNGYCTVDQFSEKWEISKRRVQILCAKGRIPGVQKFGISWAIPCDAEKPVDGRSDRKKE